MCSNLLLAISKSFGNFLSQFCRSSQNGGNPAWKPAAFASPFAVREARQERRLEIWSKAGSRRVPPGCVACVPSFHALRKKNPGEQKGGLFGIQLCDP